MKMIKSIRPKNVTHWTVPIILLVALFSGCAHEQEKKDPFVEQCIKYIRKSGDAAEEMDLLPGQP